MAPFLEKSKLTEGSWELINKHFKDDKGYQLVKHLLDSYNDFVLTKIDNIIEGFNTIEVYHQYMAELQKFKYIINVDIKNPTLSKPLIYEKDGSTKIMTPTDARNRNFTYAALLSIDLHITTQMWDHQKGDYETECKKINNVCLGKVPVMVGSRYCVLSTTKIDVDECRYGYGGYFIINGNEKVVICQDRIAENVTYVFINNKVSTYSHIAEIRSVTENKFSVPKTTSLKLSAKANQFGRYIRVNIHHVKQDVPLFILFRALGIESDQRIIEYCIPKNDHHYDSLVAELFGSVEEANTVLYTRDAREYLSKYMNINGHPKEFMQNKQYRMNVLTAVLEKEFLPHVGTDFGHKAMYLGYMVNKLLKCYLGIVPFDDRDSYINKRIDTPGILMANLFRQYYGKVVKDMKNMIQKDINSGAWKATNKFSNVITKVNVNKIVKSTIIESGLKFGLATGNWGIKSSKTKQGVAQVLNRMSYNATISHLRRINTPIEKTGKLVQPRKLHSTQWGIICPTETPEGVSVGLVKNLAVSATVTISSNSLNLRERLMDPEEFSGITLFDGKNIGIFDNGTKIIINGDIIGVTSAPDKLYAKVKQLKRGGIVNVYTGIFWNIPRNEIWICTEAGRCVRPLYVIDETTNLLVLDDEMLDKKMGWNEMVAAGAIEYLDVQDVNNAMIAMKYADLYKGFKGFQYPVKYTHMEIDPSLILGVLAGSIPFSDHNQAPRNAYQCLKDDTLVLMGDGTRKMIKDVCIGDEVVTFHPHTKEHSVTKVIHQYVKPTDKRIMKVTTESGRTIIATDDHQFMTNQGWKEVKNFDQDTLVGISIQPSFIPEIAEEPQCVLDADSFLEVLANYEVDRALAKAHVQELKDIGLLPLSSGSKALPVLARLIGFTMTMPSLDNNIAMVKKDISLLGFDKFNSTSSLASLLLVIKKDWTTWILNGSKMVKREFLAGFQGGNGNGIYNGSTCVETVLQPVHDDHQEMLMSFVDKICELFIEFGIQVTKLDHDNLGYKITGTPANLIKYFDVVGYRYDDEKIVESARVIEYMKFDKMDRKVEIHNQSLFVPVRSVEEVDNCLIADITVDNDENQSFIAADNFMVHNSAMCKQAIGIYASTFRKRFDTLGHVLYYPQKPLIYTRIGNLINHDKLPSGMNVIVAIAAYTGYNQEDSVILNKSSVDRGMFVSSYYRTYKDQNSKNHSTGEEEYYCKPDMENTKNLKPYNYTKLMPDGFVPENTYVESGDVIIGKCMPQRHGNIILNKDSSVALKNNEVGFVDKNSNNDNLFTNVNGDGYTFSKVRIRSERVPMIGDKFASRAAQKGSTGMLYNQEDMPFSASGIVPDIILNPHAIPSRMTISQLMECVMGKACASLGTFGDASPFTDLTTEDIAKALDKCGLERYGNEVMYNSRTGEMMNTEIFIGPTYYQRLKHMVVDKTHSRASNGPLILLTRQPAEGRARDGGLRLGEMEVECNWAHGTMQFLKERFMDASDNYRVFICKKCGMMANVNPDSKIYECKPCNNNTCFSQIRIPYACKLLFQEVQTMGIGAKFLT